MSGQSRKLQVFLLLLLHLCGRAITTCKYMYHVRVHETAQPLLETLLKRKVSMTWGERRPGLEMCWHMKRASIFRVGLHWDKQYFMSLLGAIPISWL